MASKERQSSQVAAALAQQIADGQWAIGQKLPSVRQLAQIHGISINTAQRMLSELEAAGLIRAQPRRRAVVLRRRASPKAYDACAFHGKTVGIMTSMDERGFRLFDSESWSRRIVESVQQALDEHALRPQLMTYRYDRPNHEDDLLKQIDQIGGDLVGVVGAQMQIFPRLRDSLDRRDIRWITLGPMGLESQHNFVSTDFAESGRLVGKLFSAMGLHRVLLVTTDPNLFLADRDSCAGFVQELLAGNSPVDGVSIVRVNDSSEQAGFDAVKTYLSKHTTPEGVYCAGDRVAIGAIRALEQIGKRVPHDVHVIGNTGLELSRFSKPSLSVIAQPMEQVGRSAAHMLVELLQSGQRELPARLFQPQLVIRESVSVPAAVREKLVSDQIVFETAEQMTSTPAS